MNNNNIGSNPNESHVYPMPQQFQSLYPVVINQQQFQNKLSNQNNKQNKLSQPYKTFYGQSNQRKIYPTISSPIQNAESSSNKNDSPLLKSKQKIKGIRSRPKLQPVNQSIISIKKKNQIETQQAASPAKLNMQSSILTNKISVQQIQETQQNYKIGKYYQAEDYFKQNKYMKKIRQGDTFSYHEFQVFDSNDQFKQFNLGVFFYLEYIKQLIFLFIFMSIIGGIQMAFNYQGIGLNIYPSSYSIKLAQFSLGNNTDNTRFQTMLQVIADTVYSIFFIIFYLAWRNFSNKSIIQYEQDPNILNPEKYSLSIVFDEPFDDNNLQKRLINQFSKRRIPPYEVEIVYDYKGLFNQYAKLEQLIEEIHSEQSLIKLGVGDQQKIQKLRKKREQKQKQLMSNDFQRIPMYAIIHFEYSIQKEYFIRISDESHFWNTWSASLYRFFCCVNVNRNQMFEQKNLILINQSKLGRPQDIYWENIDIGFCQKFMRRFFGTIFVIICLLITSTSIVLCTLYVSSNSDCNTFDPKSTLIQAKAKSQLFCFCQSNIASAFDYSSPIGVECGQFRDKILKTNGMLAVASVISTITNIVLNIFIVFIVSFMKPATRSSASSTIFLIMFLATLINSCIIPLLINASIFGYKPDNYITFLNFIDFSKVYVFNDFERGWFAYISPYYVNLLIVAIVMPWIDLLKVFIVAKCWKQPRLKKREGSVLQKQMNRIISEFRFDISSESAVIVLNTFICMVYASSLPILLVLHLLGLISNYICKKKILIKFSRRISANQDLNNIILNIMPYMMLFHIGFGIWAYTCPTTFIQQNFVLLRLNIGNWTSEFGRILYATPLLAIFALVLCFLILDYSIISIFQFLAKCLCRESNIIHPSINQQNSFNKKLKKVNILGSYKLQNNPEYRDIIRIIEKLITKKSIQQKRRYDESFNTINNLQQIQNDLEVRQQNPTKKTIQLRQSEVKNLQGNPNKSINKADGLISQQQNIYVSQVIDSGTGDNYNRNLILNHEQPNEIRDLE